MNSEGHVDELVASGGSVDTAAVAARLQCVKNSLRVHVVEADVVECFLRWKILNDK